jgi:hypothetical protein
LVRTTIFHRTPHLGNPVSNFIDGRSGFPVANRFMAEYDAADQEHLRQIT